MNITFWLHGLACDRPESHFTVTLLKNVSTEAHIRHHFTNPYCIWPNRAVECLCKEVLRLTRTLLSESRLFVVQWPTIIEGVQKIVNPSSVGRLGKNEAVNIMCLMEVFTGLTPCAILIRPMSLRRYRESKALSKARLKDVANIK